VGEFRPILKVDIATGEVLIDRLEDLWAKEAMGEGRPDPVWRENPALRLKQTGEDMLWQRIQKRIQAWAAKRSRSTWSANDLYCLARMVALQGLTYTEAARRLGRRPHSCRENFIRMRKAGII
jgi:hypothetical protein